MSRPHIKLHQPSAPPQRAVIIHAQDRFLQRFQSHRAELLLTNTHIDFPVNRTALMRCIYTSFICAVKRLGCRDTVNTTSNKRLITGFIFSPVSLRPQLTQKPNAPCWEKLLPVLNSIIKLELSYIYYVWMTYQAKLGSAAGLLCVVQRVFYCFICNTE